MFTVTCQRAPGQRVRNFSRGGADGSSVVSRRCPAPVLPDRVLWAHDLRNRSDPGNPNAAFVGNRLMEVPVPHPPQAARLRADPGHWLLWAIPVFRYGGSAICP